MVVGQQISNRFREKAAAVRIQLEARLDQILQAWLLFAGLACAARIATSPSLGPVGAESILPYLLLTLAPFASIVLALRWFTEGDHRSQPQFRLACLGRWRSVSNSEATSHPLYGAGGIMVSLTVGILINVPFRALEYLGSMPALTGEVPVWLSVLHGLMSVDVVVMSSLYAIAFVAALRHVPLFPRMLAAIWGLDLLMQLAIAKILSGTPGLPADVSSAMQSLLEGNFNKVLISIALWLPYLLLSERVNVTYRHRVPA